jgi:hypothetical protein
LVASIMRACGGLFRLVFCPAGVLAVVPAVARMADPQRPLAAALAIREAREDDWPQIWPIIHDVITELWRAASAIHVSAGPWDAFAEPPCTAGDSSMITHQGAQTRRLGVPDFA